MRTVVTQIRCDNCGEEIQAEAPDAYEWSLSFAKTGGETHQGRIDLCSECAGQWLDEVQGVLTNALPYKRPKPVVTGTGKVIEPDDLQFRCDCGRSFTKQSGLSRHKTATGH